MGEFRVGKNVYRKLIFPWVISGKRWMVQGFEIEGANGRSSLHLVFDGKAELKGSYRSDIDLGWLVPWLGNGAKPFMKSLELRSNPKISAQITGAAMKMNLIRVEGKIEVQNLAYKGVEMEELAGNVLLAGGQLTVKDLRVKAAGGEGTGEFVYGFEPEKVNFLGTRSTLPVQEFSKVFGAKFEKIMEPYLFQGRPNIVLNGEVDLEGKGGSNLHATLLAPEGMKYVVAGKMLEFTEMDMVVEVVGRKVIVQTKKEYVNTCTSSSST